MRIPRIAALAVAAVFSAGSVIAATNPGTLAQADASKPSATTPQSTQRTDGAQRPRPPQLFSAEENKQFHERMQKAKTPEERAALRKEIRAAYEQRAKEKGITLPQHAQGQHRHGEGPVAQLLTPAEQTQFRERMKNAKDRGERMQVGKELHALVTQRARGKGVTLPERGRRGPRGEHEHGPMDGAAQRSQS